MERFAKLRGIAKAEEVAQALRQVAKGAAGAEAKALSSVAEAVEKKGGKVGWKWVDEQLRVITNKSCFATGSPLLTPVVIVELAVAACGVAGRCGWAWATPALS